MSRWSAGYSCAREIAAPERTPAFGGPALHRHPIKTSCEIKRIMTRPARFARKILAKPSAFLGGLVERDRIGSFEGAPGDCRRHYIL